MGNVENLILNQKKNSNSFEKRMRKTQGVYNVKANLLSSQKKSKKRDDQGVNPTQFHISKTMK